MDLTHLRWFVRVADRGSFSAAARDFGLAQPTVSRGVRRLENHLAVQLLIRTTRSVRLTDAGAKVLEHAREVLDAVERAEDAVLDVRSAPIGRLRVTAPVGYGHHRIAPALMDWVETYEGSTVELSLTDRFVDLVAESYDVAIRIGSLQPSTLRAVRLAGEPLRLVATPVLAAEHPVRSPADLASVPFVAFSSLARPRSFTWSRGEHTETAVTHSAFTVDHLPTVRDAVLRGLGYAVVPDWLVSGDVANGTLVALLTEWSAGSFAVHALLPPGRHTPRRTKLFVEHLRAALPTT